MLRMVPGVQVPLVPLKYMHWSSSGKDTALVTGQRGFDSHPVLLVFDNPAHVDRAHDVAAACRLAMAEVRVQLPLGALAAGRRKAWYSAGHRRAALVAGARDRGFNSRRPDFIAVGPVLVRAGAC